MLALVAAAVGYLLVRDWAVDRSLPRYQGVGARVWFERMRAHAAAENRGGGSPLEELRTRRAFLEMGTNAVPFLIQQHLLLTGTKSPGVRLYEWLDHFLRSAGFQALDPIGARNQAARTLLAETPLPLTLLLPVVQAGIQSTNLIRQRSALSLLPLTRPGADTEAAAALLAREYLTTKDATVRSVITSSLSLMGAPATNVLPEIVTRQAAEPRWRGTLIALAARMGPQATAAVPTLEPWLTSTNEALRMFSAVALLNVVSNHASALEVVTRAAEASSGTRDAPSPSYSHRPPPAFLCQAVLSHLHRPHPALATLLERIARDALLEKSTTPSVAVAYQALRRAAPERARLLAREELQGPWRVESAILVLRFDRGDPQATAVLAEAIEARSWWNAAALSGLREAASTNELALATLRRYASGERTFPLRGAAAEAHARALREGAATALEWIAYREARQVRGLPEKEF
ncbi:MAG: hypothetical protein IT580_11870 [Verrucomicrobiales bacterium]|nr:hypothetical protein [Verrucomicrobiales bacterium]